MRQKCRGWKLKIERKAMVVMMIMVVVMMMTMTMIEMMRRSKRGSSGEGVVVVHNW